MRYSSIYIQCSNDNGWGWGWGGGVGGGVGGVGVGGGGGGGVGGAHTADLVPTLDDLSLPGLASFAGSIWF